MNPRHGEVWLVDMGIHLQFTAAKTDEFRKFTREHINQQTQLLVGSKVVAEPYIRSEISGGQADIDFSSIDEARVVADNLNKR
jgi:preprotein translocase subunit SecD